MEQSGEARRQKAYRDRKTQRSQRMDGALRAIIAKLAENDKPLAVELRALAEGGLE